MSGNPYDRTSLIEDDLPSEGGVSEDHDALLAAAVESREGAIRENRLARGLTESEGWRKLREYLEAREQTAVGNLIAGVKSNRDMHFSRGECAMAKLLLTYVDSMLFGSENALEAFRAADKKEESNVG